MPGITFVRCATAPKSVEASALRGVCFRDEYEPTVHADDARALLGSTGYPEYPITTVETEDAIFLLEGRLYDVDDESCHVRTAGSLLLADRPAELESWLTARDGDFLLVAYEKATETIAAVTDTFARLPVYYVTVGDHVVLSRELKLIRDCAHHRGEPLEHDPMGLAQTLLFGYQLEDRTLFDGVRRVPPGSYVRIGDDVRVRRLHRHDFGTTANDDRSVGENAAALAALFETACANRNLDGLQNVLSLSGGLDSRAVGAGYAAADVSYTAATFEKPNGANAPDVRIAERLADALDADWERYDVEGTETHREQLLEMKQGMNFLAMATVLDFLDQLRARHGPFAYVTGDGGDKALPDMTPPRSFDSRRELAEYIVETHGIFDPEEVATLTGIDRETLVRVVQDRLRSYPETAHDDLYVHFLVRERGMNWLTHGEDRNRYYCWSVSPFYSPRFFEYAMNVPASQKKRKRLYAAFLEELDPEICDIEDANHGAPVTSLRHKLKQYATGLVFRYPGLKRRITALVRGQPSGELTDRLAERFQQSKELPLAESKVANVIQNGERYDGHELYNLLTVLATADHDPDPRGRAKPKPMMPDGSGVPEDGE